MKYLIAIDLDGTLLNDLGEVSLENKNAVKRVKELGHHVVIATGRTYSGAINIYKQLELTTPMVTDNGANVVKPNDINFHNRRKLIPLNIMKSLFNDVKSYLVGSYFTVEDTTYAYKYNEEIEKSFNGSNSDKVIEGDISSFETETSILVCMVKCEKRDEFEKIINNQYNNKLKFRIWSSMSNNEFILYEIYRFDVSKYTGLQYIMDYYQLETSKYIAFGDNFNDIDMIRNAKIGVAMANAENELKQVAKVVSTYSNCESAVGKFLEEKFLNKTL